MKEQIEEMAKIIHGYCKGNCANCFPKACGDYLGAETLYNAGYRKIVNCKDCENCREYTKWNGRNYLGCTRLAELCDGQIVEVSENDFCSFAKMKGGAE